MLREGSRTPWGFAQSVRELEPGIVWVSTPSHGGFRLTDTLNRKIPNYLREGSTMREAGWYEEDCDAAIVMAVFPGTRESVSEEAVKSTFANWFPDEYERFYGVTLKEGESYRRDEVLFYKRHAEDWVVTAATGSIDPTVPKGMVGVWARKGGKRSLHGQSRRFLVPFDEYQKRGRFGFVIDLKRHAAWPEGGK